MEQKYVREIEGGFIMGKRDSEGGNIEYMEVEVGGRRRKIRRSKRERERECSKKKNEKGEERNALREDN